VQVIRTIVIADPAIRANVVEALTGSGAPVGILRCSERDDVISVRFDDEVTSADLIDDLLTIESHFAAGPAGGGAVEAADEEIARLASVGLADPDIDASRILERHLVGLE
jgi:hypothetical protein